MAFETVTGMNSKVAKKLNDGEFIEGYLKEVLKEVSAKYGTDSFPMIMVEPETQTEYKLFVNGSTLNYVAKNIAAVNGHMPRNPQRAADEDRDASLLGHLVRFTRQGSRMVKDKSVAQFLVQCDKEKKLA